MFIYGGGRSLVLSFFLLIGRGGDYESGGGAATRNPFPAENIPEVACQDLGIFLTSHNVMQEISLLTMLAGTTSIQVPVLYKTL